MAKIKTIEEKYQEMSEREHILERSGMWIGSTKEEEAQMFLYNKDTAKGTVLKRNHDTAGSVNTFKKRFVKLLYPLSS